MKTFKSIFKALGSLACAILFAGIPHLSGQTGGMNYRQFGPFSIALTDGWTHSQAESSGNYYMFGKGDLKVGLKNETTAAAAVQDINKVIIQITQQAQASGEFVEQRKQSTPVSFLGQNQCQRLTIKSRSTGARRFVFLPVVDGNLYEVVVTDPKAGIDPSNDAMYFMALTYLTGEPGGAQIALAAAGKWKQTGGAKQDVVAAPEDDQLSQFKKVKSNIALSDASTKQQPQESVKESDSDTSASSSSSAAKVPDKTNEKDNEGFTPPETLNFSPPVIEKGAIPEVKFSATDPCTPGSNIKGLPWEDVQQKKKIKLPKGVNVAMPPKIPDLQNLAQFNYQAAVSAAFEGLRLVYGPLPDDEAKKFEGAWIPLFDYPTQEIIDYLNKLNPIVSQFLACRETYIRNLVDIHIVMLDAALAIEADDRHAWEMAMAEAALYTKILQPIENTMKFLADQLETLGNPPNPNTAKCEARRRYNRFFKSPVPEGCWAGYQDDLAISDGKYHMFGPEENEVMGQVYSPIFAYIFKVNVNGAEKYYSIETCIDCNLGLSDVRGNCSSGDYSDTFIRQNIFGRESYSGTWIDGPRQGEESQFIQKFEYPNIPEFSQISDDQIRDWISRDAAGNNERHGSSVWAPFLSKMLEEKSIAPRFFETALNWTRENRWQEFDFSDESWMPPDQLLIAFHQDMMSGIIAEEKEKENEDSSKSIVNQEGDIDKDQKAKEEQQLIEAEEQSRKESIAFHTEMINIIKHNLERDIADRNEAIKKLSMAKTESEAKNHAETIKEFNMRIIHHQSNMQAEHDLVASYETGQLVRTRTVFDEYAKSTFIDNIRENAARIDATRRIAERIERQIELLPYEMRAKARERALDMLDAETIATGDIEKAKRLVNAIGKQIEGYAEYDHAIAVEAEVDAQQNEFYTQMFIVAAGAAAIGFGTAALTEVYGANAAITIYGSKAIGAVYGGVTGCIAGGPKEGLTQAVSYWSPYGYMATQFIDGFRQAGYQSDATISSQVWEGVKQAGSAYLLGKVFEIGARLATKGGLIFFGKDSRLFKPIVQTPSQRARQMLDGMRTQQRQLNAKDEVRTFKRLESELALLKRDPVANQARITETEKQLNQLAAGLNANYHAKWELKYKADPLTRSKFDRRVQQNYSEMTPGMKHRLEQQGYNMDGIEFVQFRNANSGGSSSMDLDLGPVVKGTGAEPGVKMFTKKMVIKKDGSVVSLDQFMDDAQMAMNAEYRQLTGMSARASDMNLVTSVHPEAFSSPRLLDKNLDFSTLTPEELKSVGQVLRVKTEGINKNQMMTNTTKMQAKAREASKEIENMLLKKLQSDLQSAPAGSPQQKQLQSDIKYWEDMLRRLKQMGTEESNPMKLIEMNREIMHETGGRDANGVINDLIARFR